MRRRGGGNNQSSQPSTGTYSSRETMPSHSNRQYIPNIFSPEKLRTILLTSLVWSFILAIAIFTTIQSYSSNDCSQNSIMKSKRRFIF